MNKLILTLVLFYFFVPCFAQNEWSLAKEKDGIKIYTRQKENSKIKEFKAKMICDISPEIIINELENNVANHTKWLADVSASKTLKEENGKQFNYYKLDMPWPAADRDMVLEAQKTKLEKGYKVDMKSAYSFSEPVAETIRIKHTGGYWLIVKNAIGKTDVEYMFFADPAGSLPTWVINMFIVDGPLESMKNLRELLK